MLSNQCQSPSFASGCVRELQDILGNTIDAALPSWIAQEGRVLRCVCGCVCVLQSCEKKSGGELCQCGHRSGKEVQGYRLQLLLTLLPPAHNVP